MKVSAIQVGKTYVNRGAGRTRRMVLGIGDEYRPSKWWNPSSSPPDEPGVLFEQDGKQGNLYITSFAQWAGRMD